MKIVGDAARSDPQMAAQWQDELRSATQRQRGSSTQRVQKAHCGRIYTVDRAADIVLSSPAST